MAIPVEMPKMSDTMEEGVLVAWLANEGDEINPGDVIAQVETDKATMDLEAYDSGVLLKRVVAEGDSVPIGSLIAVLGKSGEDVGSVLNKYQGKNGSKAETTAEPAAETAPAPAATSGDGAVAPAPAAPVSAEEEGRTKASPLARKLAQEYGVSLQAVTGSGPEGRIVKRDVEAAISKRVEPAPTPAARPEPAPVEEPAAPMAQKPAVVEPGSGYTPVKITQMRKAIARRLSQSKYTSPHFYLTVDVDMEKAITFRNQLNELAESQKRAKVSFNDLITKACALALRLHPYVNASYLETEGEIRQYDQVHVSIAVAMEEGLITPVIRNADQKGLAQIAEETRQLAEKARNKQLQPHEFEGSTFTTSNLGMFGIEEFTAIINPPNACILAIGAIRDVPVVRNGEVVPGKRMKLTLSCDHRIVDGATGAQFLGTVVKFLEEPLSIVL